MTVRRAACCCGQLSLACSGDPVRISVCHCLECQRRTGSAFGVQARFRREDVAIAGEASVFRRGSDGGGDVTFRFCPRCGSTLCWELEGVPGFVAVAVGAFADPAFAAPTVFVYEGRRHPWLAALADLPGAHHP
jgi:hypothetical protein